MDSVKHFVDCSIGHTQLLFPSERNRFNTSSCVVIITFSLTYTKNYRKTCNIKHGIISVYSAVAYVKSGTSFIPFLIRKKIVVNHLSSLETESFLNSLCKRFYILFFFSLKKSLKKFIFPGVLECWIHIAVLIN